MVMSVEDRQLYRQTDAGKVKMSVPEQSQASESLQTSEQAGYIAHGILSQEEAHNESSLPQ